jgi:DsbC/DsbD-like thiol-disulfide interchange protein
MPKANELVKAELLADVAAVKPGEEFTLGVRLTIKPKWHVYWKYPGDAGLPTTVKWTLPGDASATQPETRLPMPVRFDQAGEVIGYGYKDEALLTARVKAPTGSAGTSAQYIADVSYLVCEDICIPGKAKVELSIPLADESKPANKELFEKWVAQIPRVADDSSRTALKLDRSSDRDFTAHFAPAADTKTNDIQWFPLPPKGVSVENSQTKSDGNASVFSFQLVPPPKQSGGAAAVMQFLVTYTDPSGKRQGIEFGENLPQPSNK